LTCLVTEPLRHIALAAATRLSGQLGETNLPADVEAELARDDEKPRAYADPVSIASLIVAIAGLAWNIYSELRRSPRELAGEVRTRWERPLDETTGSVIDVVAEETVKHSER
jgi:hypothetical protein